MDCAYYKLFNDDLKIMNNAQLSQHYRLHGCRENRMINRQNFHEKYPEFDVEEYRQRNRDLHHFPTEFELIKHFWMNGRFEERVINNKSDTMILHKNYRIENSYSFQSWEIFKLDRDSCRRYFQSLIGEEKQLEDYGENVQGPTPKIPDVVNIAYSRRILNHFIRTNKIFNFTDPKDNNSYPVLSWTITFTDTLTILYNCGHFIVCQDTPYADFYFILYPEDHKILQITHSTNANIQKVLCAYSNPQLKCISSSTNAISEPKIFLFLGFIHNIGHCLWNELSALYYTITSDTFINNKHLFQRIILGPCDFFDYTSIIKRMLGDHGIPIIKIQDVSDLYSVLDSETNDQRTVLPLWVGCYRIPLGIESVLGFDFKENFCLLSNRNHVTITIGIRTNSKCLLDTIDFYTTIIQVINEWLKSFNKTLSVKITGSFTSFCCNTSCIEESISAQLDIFQQIQKRLPNIEIESFIGYPLEQILEKVGYSDIMIAPIGTSVPNLANWIFRSDLICLSSPQNKNWISGIQFECNDNYNLTAISDPHIIECESSSTHANFRVEIPIVIETIKKYLVSKM